MKRYVSYLRVSTSRQGESGLGLEAQRTAVAQYVVFTGGELIDEVVEVESGRLKDRPGLTKALTRSRAAGAILVIARLDRLARNVAFVSSLMESGVEFVAVDAPYANKLMLHILAAFGEHEREMIAARTRAALQAAKTRGVKLGTHGAILAERHRAEARAFANQLQPLIAQASDQGCTTLQSFADFLNDRGVLSRRGVRWSPGTVSRILKRLSVPP